MSTSPKPEFLLLLRHYGTMPSPDEMAKLMEKFLAWVNGLKARGEFVTSSGLEFTGKLVRTHGVVSDGPFVEAKEMVGGFLIVRVDHLDRAVEIAQGCPAIANDGTSVEVRPLRRRDN
ncbi:MAG TPA: YciI family protein [Opitutus sp.]|nr:YciI family protein [Opitutus sp.]